MKTTMKYLAVAFAIVATASCSKENMKEPEQPKTRMTFEAAITQEHEPEVDKKTSLNSKSVEWKADDQIVLYGNGAYKTSDAYNVQKGYMTIDSETLAENNKLASFTGNVASSADYCAFYPSTWTADNANDYKYQFPGFALQNAVKDSFDPDKHVMAAGSLNGNRFEFKNICALAKVTIGTDQVYSVKIEGRAQFGNDNYASIGGIYCWKVSATHNEYAAVSSSNIHSITLKNEDGSALEKGATYYIVLPVCEIKDFKVSICDADGNSMGTRSKTSNFNVERNKIYDLGTLSLPTNYKIKTPDQPVYNAQDLVSGKQYMIFFSKAADHTQEDSFIWKLNTSDGSISKVEYTDKTKSVNNEYVFTYEKYADVASFLSYESHVKGRLKSPYYTTNMYMDSNFKFTAQYGYASQTLMFANHWEGDENNATRCDIDIYKDNSETDTIWDNDGTLTWGTNANSPRKFFFYEVELSY